MEDEFYHFYLCLPENLQKTLDKLGINNFDDLFGYAVLRGVDLVKLEKFIDSNNEEGIISVFEDLLNDKDNSLMNHTLSSEYEEYDPLRLPVNCIISEKPQELHLRVKLNDAPTPVWREILVPSNVTLEFFAFVINCVMGWEGIHMHKFKTNDAQYKNTECLRMDREMNFGFGRILTMDSNVFPISNFFTEKKDKIYYEYDFGDSWEHVIWLKGIREYAPDEVPTLKVIKGKGQCPPEDCGGVGGYAELLYILAKKRKTRDDKDRLEWYGIDKWWDAEFFDIEYAQEELNLLWEEALS